MNRLLPLLSLLLIPACTAVKPAAPVKSADFGTVPKAGAARIFTLENANGLRARITEYGAILVSMEVPDRAGKLADITLGYDTLPGWLSNTSYLGSTVGRYGNRIADGKFTLDGVTYQLAKNNDPGGIPCHLHGGIKGFDKVLWSGKPVSKGGATGVELITPARTARKAIRANSPPSSPTG